MKRVVIIGGGVAGLTTAIHLKDGAAALDGGLEVLVLEASPTTGGNILTDRVQGFTIEQGPNGFLDNVPATLSLVRRLGLENQLQRADESAARRFLFRDGRLHLLPSGPWSFLTSPVLSLRGRLRVFREPLARLRHEGVDESIFDFASRRIGAEAASILVDAMVSGVFAGDARSLSLASSFPKMARMEEEHGGLVRAMLARMRERGAVRRELAARRARGEEVDEALTKPGGPAGPGGTLTSFQDGLDVLPKTLTRELGDSVRVGASATEILEGRPWAVRTSEGAEIRADAVVLALPSPKAAPLLRTVDEALADVVSEIPTAGLAVIAMALDAETVKRKPNGFGFLVPRGQGVRTLGCLWDSSIFPGRAPSGRILLRAMIGGAHDPTAVEEPTDALVAQVLDDLRTTMDLEAEPLFTRVYRWPLGIGQYTLGHQDRLDRMHARLSVHPGLWVAGSSFYGISMNACIEKAAGQTDEILGFLASPVTKAT